MRVCLVLVCLQALAALRIAPLSGSSSSSRLDPVLQSTLRLPIWPVYGGVLAQVADWLGLKGASRSILDGIGGRVIPMQLNGERAFADSRLLLLVHHKHSFTKGDPFRALTRLLMPEGFPAHGHSGLMTVTMTREGGAGLAHRDSEGLSQDYGGGDVQWMKSGRGILHEEMWSPCRAQERLKEDVELYQLWVDIPREQKELPPATTVVRRAEMPVHTGSGFHVKAVAGDVAIASEGGEARLLGAQAQLSTAALDIVALDMGARCLLRLEADPTHHVFVHVTSGSIEVPSAQGPLVVQQGDLLKYAPAAARDAAFEVRAAEGARLLVMAGPPAADRVVMHGPCVASSEQQLAGKLRVFEAIGPAYWPHTLPDDEWRRHIDRFSLRRLLDGAELSEGV